MSSVLMTNLLYKALIWHGQIWYWSLLRLKGINGIYTGITWLACGRRRKGRREERKGTGDMRRKESFPPHPHSPSIFALADHAIYDHHTFLVSWFKLCQEPVIGYWFLFIIDLLCYIKTMVISDTLFCHRVALTNASAWSLNKFYIIQCNVALRIISTSTLKYKLQQNTSKWKVYSKRAITKEAWENSRHFAKLPLVSAKWRLRNERRNSILMTRHYPDLGSASDWSCRGRNLPQPIRSTTLVWVLNDASSGWNFCARLLDVISQGNQWWRREMSAVFSIKVYLLRADFLVSVNLVKSLQVDWLCGRRHPKSCQYLQPKLETRLLRSHYDWSKVSETQPKWTEDFRTNVRVFDAYLKKCKKRVSDLSTKIKGPLLAG